MTPNRVICGKCGKDITAHTNQADANYIHARSCKGKAAPKPAGGKNDPIDLGPLYEESPSGELVPCKATIARTQYVEFLLARYPWASDADILLALDGWDKTGLPAPV